MVGEQSNEYQSEVQGSSDRDNQESDLDFGQTDAGQSGGLASDDYESDAVAASAGDEYDADRLGGLANDDNYGTGQPAGSTGGTYDADQYAGLTDDGYGGEQSAGSTDGSYDADRFGGLADDGYGSEETAGSTGGSYDANQFGGFADDDLESNQGTENTPSLQGAGSNANAYGLSDEQRTSASETGFATSDNESNIDINLLDTNQFAMSLESSKDQGIQIDLDSEMDSEQESGEPLFASETNYQDDSPENQQELESSYSSFDSGPASVGTSQQGEAQAGQQTLPTEQFIVPDRASSMSDDDLEDEEQHGTPSPLDTSNFVRCVVCESKIPPIAVYCSFCGANQKELKSKKKGKKEKAVKQAPGTESELVIKSIRITSFLFFLGGLGIIAGVLVGATFGVLKEFLSDLHSLLPIMLQETRGGFTGGLIFAAIGGISGFIIAALLSIVLSGVYNLVAFVFGGIRFKVKS
jgi:hypothetical protein